MFSCGWLALCSPDGVVFIGLDIRAEEEYIFRMQQKELPSIARIKLIQFIDIENSWRNRGNYNSRDL